MCIRDSLIKEGYLKRTPRGRVAMAEAYHHLGRLPPDDGPVSGEQLDLL